MPRSHGASVGEADAGDAAAAVPQGYLDRTCLLGPPAAVRDRLAAYASAGATTLVLAPMGTTAAERLASLRTAAEALDAAGLAA